MQMLPVRGASAAAAAARPLLRVADALLFRGLRPRSRHLSLPARRRSDALRPAQLAAAAAPRRGMSFMPPGMGFLPPGMSFKDVVAKMNKLREDPDMQKLMRLMAAEPAIQSKCAELLKKMRANGAHDPSIMTDVQALGEFLETKGIDRDTLVRLAKMFETTEPAKPAQPEKPSGEKSAGEKLLAWAKGLAQSK